MDFFYLLLLIVGAERAELHLQGLTDSAEQRAELSHKTPADDFRTDRRPKFNNMARRIAEKVENNPATSA